jgi:hypothetical protein
MTERPDLAALARRYLDLWEHQVAAMASDPALAEQLTRLFRAIGDGMAAVAGGVEGHESHKARRGAGKAGAAAAAAASGGGGVELAELARRLAALERRLEKLEAAGARPGRKPAARARKRTRRG